MVFMTFRGVGFRGLRFGASGYTGKRVYVGV